MNLMLFENSEPKLVADDDERFKQSIQRLQLAIGAKHKLGAVGEGIKCTAQENGTRGNWEIVVGVSV